MLNRYPLWKYLLILITLLVGILYALPNVYGEDPAVQVSASKGQVDPAARDLALDALKQAGIPVKGSEIENGKLLIRFDDPETQLKAVDVVQAKLGSPAYTAALNLAPSTPKWLQALGAVPMYLGLDLRGGVHFLMEVDMKAAVAQAEERYVGEFRTLLREKKVRYSMVERDPHGGVSIKFPSADQRAAAKAVLDREYNTLILSDVDTGGIYLKATLRPQEAERVRKFALEQNITTLRNRVNELGVAEPVIQQQGDSRVVVELPGVQDTARAKDILGATATLEFRLVDEQHNAMEAKATGHVPPADRLYHERNGNPVLLERRVLLTGDYITDASSGIDRDSGGAAVYITLDGKGARLFSHETRDKIGRLMAVVYIETKTVTKKGADGKLLRTTQHEENVINVARIRDELGKRFQITGLDSPQEARNLALLLRAGALAAPISIVEERTVGPSLGKDNIDQGVLAAKIGFIVVLVFMALYYRTFGLIADLALGFNVVLMVAVLSIMTATLTLPGIAGIVLTMGMAVDANVLIYERIREELRLGNTPQASIHAGYEKAFSTIADANITTLIAAVVLFSFGTGPIKGFAVTLSIGILTSMFTAIMGTRALVNLIYGGRRVERLSI